MERDHFRLGLIGTLIVVLLLALALNASAIVRRLGTHTISAVFSEAGGLAPGDEVRMAGTTVGTVTQVRLDRAQVVVSMRIQDDLPLKDRSQAAIRTATILGRKYVGLSSQGSAPLKENARIPRERTTAPYDVTQALADLTTSTGGIKTDQLADALDTGTEVFTQTPESFGKALEGIRALSDTIASRDQQLTLLLQRTQSLTGELAQRRDALMVMVANGNALMQTVLQQRAAVESLFQDLNRLVEQIRLLVHDGRTTLHPALVRLSKALDLVNNRRTDLDLSLRRLGPFLRSLGEAVGSGPFFLAYLGNMTPQGFPATAVHP